MLFAFGFYDYITFAVLTFILVSVMVIILMVLGLPGKLARKRNHPDADAVNTMGWLGFLGGVPWFQALIWAFKETETVDIRRFPKEEQAALRQQAEQFEAELKKKKEDKWWHKLKKRSAVKDSSDEDQDDSGDSPDDLSGGQSNLEDGE